MNKKLLAAIDGSSFSSNSLDYIIRLFKNDKNISVHLFSVVSVASGDQNWMFEVDPLREHSPATDRKRITAEKYLRDAKTRLVGGGFAPDDVTFSTEITSSQIATSIHHEAGRGKYDALVIGRRGIGRVGEMLLGSVSSHLVDKCHEVPIWIIDGEITSSRFLLAVHCMPKSLIAADHLGFIIHNHPDVEVLLYHSRILFRREPKVAMEEFYRQWGKEWCDQYLDPDNYLFYAHAQILKDHGVRKQSITQLPMKTELDASRDLIRQAKKHDCGTIVVGRRPRGSEKGIFGGVSDRTLGQAQNLALWIVG
ncbi:MAG: universal stress protein [Desulfobulbaceae bacterium]|nr:universal stress protein [Desulfobulbaceae bacterium]